MAKQVPKYAGQTVAQILQKKQGGIKQAPLPKGSPGWDDIMDMTWEEVDQAAKQRKRGFSTIRKLLIDSRFDK